MWHSVLNCLKSVEISRAGVDCSHRRPYLCGPRELLGDRLPRTREKLVDPSLLLSMMNMGGLCFAKTRRPKYTFFGAKTTSDITGDSNNVTVIVQEQKKPA